MAQAGPTTTVNTPNLKADDFDAAIATGVTAVDFYADWCQPCHVLGNTIAELTHDYAGRATIAKLDVDTHSDIALRYGISSIPAVLIFRDGQLVDQTVGLVSKATLAARLEAALG